MNGYADARRGAATVHPVPAAAPRRVAQCVVAALHAGPRSVTHGEREYVEFLTFRTQILLSLLDAGIDVWVTEADAVWLSSPFRDADPAADLTTPDDDPPRRKVSSGMMFLRATPPARAFLDTMLGWQQEVLETNGYPTRKKSDPLYNGSFSLCDEATYISENYASSGVTIAWLPTDRYVSGRWYAENELNSTRETVIQNNFIVGTEAKIRRAREFGHWFLDSQGSCVGKEVDPAMLGQFTSSSMFTLNDANWTGYLEMYKNAGYRPLFDRESITDGISNYISREQVLLTARSGTSA